MHPSIFPADLRASLPEVLRDMHIETHAVVGSTNDLALTFAREHLGVRALFAADSQTAGRGRRGRNFYSPAKTGLYMSVVIPAEDGDLSLCTVAAAVAVSDALQALYGTDARIKWVNDLFADGRKVCGVLSEGISDQGGLRSAVVGIGINLTTADFPEDIRHIAGSIGAPSPDRNALCAAVTARLFARLREPRAQLIKAYTARQLLLGKEVVYTRRGSEFRGTAVGIGEHGELLVRLADGSRHVLFTGEVTLGSGQFTEQG